MLQKKEKGVDGKLGMYPRVILQFFLVIFNQMGLGNHRAEGENFLTPPKNRPTIHCVYQSIISSIKQSIDYVVNQSSISSIINTYMYKYTYIHIHTYMLYTHNYTYIYI